jgi:predicted transcriptional regulator
MHTEATYKLLGHLYEIVPATESQWQIAKETFENDNKTSADEILNELLNEGYIYEWKNDEENETNLYGLTIKGIRFYEKHLHGNKFSALNNDEPELPPKKETEPVNATIESIEEEEEEEKQKFTFRRAIPVILLIIFAIAIVWYITHIKKQSL